VNDDRIGSDEALVRFDQSEIAWFCARRRPWRGEVKDKGLGNLRKGPKFGESKDKAVVNTRMVNESQILVDILFKFRVD
jgi:hypothetical protein